MEQWKYIDNNWVSDLGNVKYNGKVTKCNGYFFLTKEKEYVHILVAKAFCNWFDGCDVHHINLNKLDNRVENLICLTHEEHSKIHKIERVKSRVKHITQYTLDGKFIAEYNSLTEAREKTGIKITKKTFTSGGYLWCYDGETPNDGFKDNHSILQFKKNGDFVKEYRSQIEAAEENGFTKQGINSCLKGRLKTAYGYIWRYKEGF